MFDRRGYAIRSVAAERSRTLAIATSSLHRPLDTSIYNEAAPVEA